MLGQTISHYRILEKLGEGGMGVVYRAKDYRLEREVALKFLPPDLTRDPHARQRFIQEARAASALDHPNICPLYDIGETEDGRLFLVMPSYRGETLQEKLGKGPLSIEEVLDLAIQIASALSEAHQHGIIHRDVKPGNLFVTEQGVVKLLDFGLAKLAGTTRLTQAGMVMGTVSHMSPEQAEGAAVDLRTDIWALGVLMYEMATGKLPFSGEHPQAVIRSILNDRPVPLTRIRVGAPSELERIVERALAKKPEERYAGTPALLADLRDLGGLLDSRRVTAPASPRQRSPRPGYRYGLGALSVVLIASVLFITFRSRAPVPVTGIDSIAVLPLENLMGDPEQNHFVEGMHEALIMQLAAVGALRVISRTSTLRYRETNKPLPEIARELEVDALVEGSVLRDGGRVRITAQLIHGPTDRHLWARSYDRDLRDVLSLVSEVAREIAGEIQVALTPEEERRLARSMPVSPVAHEEYLRGRYALNGLGPGIRESLGHFAKAIEADPRFAPAHAGRAMAYFTLGYFEMEPWSEIVPQARTSALRALDIDDGLGEAHTAMGWIRLYFDWDWAGAERAFLRALEINPSDAFARHGYADYLIVTGRPEEGARQVLIGRQADPWSMMAAAPVAPHLFYARRYDEALEECEKLVEAFPGTANVVRGFQADTLWSKGSHEEALRFYRESWNADGALLQRIDEAYADGGPRAALRAAAEELEARSLTGGAVTPHRIARLYARGDDPVRAIEWLSRALDDRRPETLHTFADPIFDDLRQRPDFQELRRRIGLP